VEAYRVVRYITEIISLLHMLCLYEVYLPRLSITQLSRVEWFDDNKIMSCKECGRKWSWTNLGTFLTFSWGD
jgi:hypothetical protein